MEGKRIADRKALARELTLEQSEFRRNGRSSNFFIEKCRNQGCPFEEAKVPL
jgi:hypothetical protein